MERGWSAPGIAGRRARARLRQRQADLGHRVAACRCLTHVRAGRFAASDQPRPAMSCTSPCAYRSQCHTMRAEVPVHRIIAIVLPAGRCRAWCLRSRGADDRHHEWGESVRNKGRTGAARGAKQDRPGATRHPHQQPSYLVTTRYEIVQNPGRSDNGWQRVRTWVDMPDTTGACDEWRGRARRSSSQRPHASVEADDMTGRSDTRCV